MKEPVVALTADITEQTEEVLTGADSTAANSTGADQKLAPSEKTRTVTYLPAARSAGFPSLELDPFTCQVIGCSASVSESRNLRKHS